MFAKYFMTAALLGLSVCAQAQAEEKYVLYKKGSSLPVGTKIVTKTRVNTENMKMKLADKIDNGGSILTQDLSEALQLGKDRIQLEVKESATVTKMKIGGKVLPEQKKQGELLKIKLLGVRKDGKWDFKPANASLQLSPKQQQQLGNVSFGFVLNDCYSEVPRSVGETWDDGHGYLKLLTGVDQGLQGENKVTFDEVVDYQGQQCAVLTRKFHVTVRLDQGYSMKMTGEETTIRSLSQFFDL